MTRRTRILDAWARMIAARSCTILWVAAGLTLLSGLAATRLHLRAGRIDLLGEDDPVAQRWLDFAEDFGSPNGIVLLVGGADADRQRGAIDTIAAHLAPHRTELYRTVFYRVEEQFLHRFGAYYFDEHTLHAVADQYRLLQAPPTEHTWDYVIGRLERRIATELRSSAPPESAQLEFLAELFEQWATTLETGDAPVLDVAHITGAASSSIGPLPLDAKGYLVSDDGAYHLLVIDPRATREDDAVFLLPFMDTIAAGIDAAKHDTPDLDVLMTGMSAYAYSDTQIMQRELPWLTAAGLVCVIVIFLLAFGSLRPALYTAACLVLAIVWTVGLTALTIGHLTLLSSVFGLILVGLGIDYGIHLLSLYQDARRDAEPVEALAAVYRHGVNGILTGGVTTAIAFAYCGLADFAAVSELGWITAMGICCNLVAMLTVLPALVLRHETRGRARRAAGHLLLPLDRAFAGLGAALQAKPVRGIALGGMLALALVPRANEVEFDHNFLHMQPADTPFSRAESVLETRTSFAPQFNLVLAESRAEADALAERLQALPTVRQVSRAAHILPRPGSAHHAAVEQVRAAALAASVPPPPDQAELERVSVTLDRLRLRFAAYTRASFATTDKARMRLLDRAARALEHLREAKYDLAHATWLDRQDTFFASLAGAWGEGIGSIADTMPSPPTLRDLPPDVRSRFLGRSGRQAIYIIPKQSLWDHPFLLRFNADVASVAPAFTGMGTVLEHLIGQASAAPRQVAPWVAAGILSVLVLDFRRIRDVAGAAGALVLGVYAALGLIQLCGLQFTPINVLAVPLLLGIGIDNSVHVLHAWRGMSTPTLERLLSTTGKAVFLASATTLVSFGLLSLSSHRGLAGFGKVMAIGVLTCFVVSILVLPCVWRLIHRTPAVTKRETIDA